MSVLTKKKTTGGRCQTELHPLKHHNNEENEMVINYSYAVYSISSLPRQGVVTVWQGKQDFNEGGGVYAPVHFVWM